MYGLAVRGTDPILYPTDITTVVTTTTDAGFTIRKLYMVAVKEAIPTATTTARNIEAMNTAAITTKITEAELPDALQSKTKAHQEEHPPFKTAHPDARQPKMKAHQDAHPPFKMAHPDARQPKMKAHQEERPPFKMAHQDARQPKMKAHQEERPLHNQPKMKAHREEHQLHNQPKTKVHREEHQLHSQPKMKAHQEEQPYNRQHNLLKIKAHREEQRNPPKLKNRPDEIRHQAAIPAEESKNEKTVSLSV